MKKTLLLKRLFPYVKPYRHRLVAIILSAILSVAATLLGPILIGRAVDHIVGVNQVDFSNLIPIILLFILTIGASTFFQWLFGMLNGKLSNLIVQDLRIAAFAKIHALYVKEIDNHKHGDLIARLTTDISQIETGLLQGATQLFTGIALIIGTFIFMFSINVWITFVVFLLTPLSIFVAWFVARTSNKHFNAQAALQGSVTGIVNEMISNEKIIKAMSYEDIAQQIYGKANEELHDYGVKAQFYASLTNPSTRLVNAITYAAVGIIGAFNAIRGTMTVGEITSFLTFAMQYTKPFNEVTGILNELQTAFFSTERVFGLLDLPQEDILSGVAMEQTKGAVEFQNIGFSYIKERPFIKNFSISVPPGSKIAIVGPTGAGKTTLVNLLMRFYDVEEGQILIDHMDIMSMKKESLRKLYGMVLQDTWLSTASIRDNIAYGKPDATMKEIIAAAQKAHAHYFITQLPDGYDTMVTNGQDLLSQGQRQLISIARVMLLNAPILILDEATSNIDTRTELYIRQAFDAMMRNKTSFIVAHRLSTIQSADTILVIRDGNIVEQGNHEALLAKNGFYTQLFNSQFPSPTGKGS